MTSDTSHSRVSHSLVRKLWFLLTLIFLITYFSISLIVLYNVGAYLREHAKNELSAMAAEKLGVVKREFSYQLANIQAWAGLDVMSDLITDDVDKRIVLALQKMKSQYQCPGDIYAFDAAGKLIASSAARWKFGSRLPVRWQAAIKRGAIFVTKHANPYGNGNIVIFLAAVHASFLSERTIGFLVLTYPWEAVVSELSKDDGRLILLDSGRGDSVLYSNVGRALSPDTIKALDHRRTRIDLNGADYWVGYSHGLVVGGGVDGVLPTRQNWVIAAFEPAGGMFTPLSAVWRQITLWVLLLGAPMSLLLVWVSRQFIRPITDLTSVAGKMSESPDLSVRIDVRRDDEIGALQKAFNHMIDRLQQTLEEQGQAAQMLKELNSTLEAMATTDALTQLPNRRSAEARFSEEIARARRNSEVFAVAICDLDNFKLINDHFGHKIGDRVLKHAADVLRHSLRPDDWIARWGGEEFLLFLHRANGAGALVVTERVRDALRSQPLEIDQATITITASFGISVLDGTDKDFSRLLSEADECLYEAKRNGRNCVVAHVPTRQGVLKRATELTLALQEKRVVPAYQVIVNLTTKGIVASEALARICLPNGTPLAAGEFIEAAEDTHLIHLVDDSISHQVMENCLQRLQQGPIHADCAYFINLSPDFLMRDGMVEALLNDARKFWGENKCDAGMFSPFVLEITERQFLNNFDGLRTKLQPLLDFGFRLALDDFGSGYSSFLYLVELPISFLKIEKRMVQNVRHNPAISHIVRGIVALAHIFKITTIAEGVEDAETAAVLRELGVDWGQGYYFGRPQCDTDQCLRAHDQQMMCSEMRARRSS